MCVVPFSLSPSELGVWGSTSPVPTESLFWMCPGTLAMMLRLCAGNVHCVCVCVREGVSVLYVNYPSLLSQGVPLWSDQAVSHLQTGV